MLPTEPIGSIPRPARLVAAIGEWGSDDPRLDPLYEEAVRETVAALEATGSPVVTDGEQRKYHNFWTYCVHGLPNTAPDGFRIPFAAGHTRRMPRLTAGPFRYRRYADSYLDLARRFIDLNNLALSRLTAAERLRMGVHTCPGTTDDCGFAPFCDDRSTTRETALARIRARVDGTRLASRRLGVDG